MKNLDHITKPSELIRVALVDLEKAEKSPRYQIAMEGGWHDPYPNEGTICAVSLAGAMMAFSLSAPVWIDTTPEDFPKSTEQKLVSLDLFLDGCVTDGLSSFYGGGREFGVQDFCDICPYSEDGPAQFKADMRKLADDLEQAGY